MCGFRGSVMHQHNVIAMLPVMVPSYHKTQVGEHQRGEPIAAPELTITSGTDATNFDIVSQSFHSTLTRITGTGPKACVKH
jgi:hypothetical protein